MLQQLERRWLPVIMKPIARFIEGTGISPNALTILGRRHVGSRGNAEPGRADLVEWNTAYRAR